MAVAGSGAWQSVQTQGTLVVLTGLVNGTTYDVRVRSVDTSGNVLNDTGATDVTATPSSKRSRQPTTPRRVGRWR